MEQEKMPRLTRLTAILTLLQSKQVFHAAEAAKKFNVSKRTIYRDMKTLERAGVPIYTEPGKGYSLLEGFKLPPVMLTEEEANALVTAGKLVAKNRDGSFARNHQDAIAKIKAVLRYAKRDKANLLSERVAILKNFEGITTSDNLSKIQLAITNRRLLQLQYHSISKDEVTVRTVGPQALYNTSENWILIAWCRLRNGYREFRLDRMKSVHKSSERFESREFNLSEYFSAVTTKNKTANES
ncbi:helix-turn-helix transcriptional regulator [Fodinibius salsisoli]|uniref:YafY family transcriptional regulator n=1 Tax=Fodinibius salsisoli TaxID=2820877 RepID=A0ABT3PLZ1_9BACT|nr:YafY family protein [Fodinibius salsisoli]MCW9706937.1 YafY family transcriptional regulator [Fodinibius salsisoli]